MNTQNVRYASSHEWARKEGNKVVMGISEFAAHQLGDVVFVDMPTEGTAVSTGKTLGVVESVKTVSDLYAPVSGKVLGRNEELEGDPALVNQDPLGKGWMLEIEMSNPQEFDALMDAAAYEKFCAAAGH